MAQAPKDIHPFVKIILAETEVERDAARAALHKANAEAPTDREVIGEFLMDCTTLDGSALALNAAGAVSVGAEGEGEPASYPPRYNEAKPFFVKGREYAAIQEAVDAAAAASQLAENNFSSDITQQLQPGVYSYAGSAVAFAQFRNGVDLDALAADEDGVPDLGRRARAFVATSSQPTQHHMTDMTIPAKAQVYPPEIAQALREGLTMTEMNKPMPMAMDSYDRGRDTALMGEFLLRHGPKVDGSGGAGAPLHFCVGSRKWVDCPNGVSDAMRALRQQMQEVDDNGLMYRDLDEDWGVIANEAGEITHRATTNRSIFEVTYLGRSGGPLQSGPLTVEEAGIAPRPTAQRPRG